MVLESTVNRRFKFCNELLARLRLWSSDPVTAVTVKVTATAVMTLLELS